MISILKKVISEHPKWLQSPGAVLSFMKMSTPASGKKPNHGKVLIFVFEEGNDLPTICVKTTRVYSAGDIIRRDRANLKLLAGNMFAKPLHIYDDGRTIFSVESVCPGKKYLAKNHGVESVIDTYITWQKDLARSSKNILRKNDLNILVRNTIAGLNLATETSMVLQNHYEELSIDPDVALPELIQHGDLTPDNVLVSGKSVYFIDYDYVGVSNIAGFDLFQFLSKSWVPGKSFRSEYERYFPLYFQAIGASLYFYDALFFLYYLQETSRKGCGGKTSKEIINDFQFLLKR